MSRYFFNVTDIGKKSEDFEGSELPNDEVARQDALAIIGQRAHDELQDGDHRLFSVELLNEKRQPILSASLSLVVTYALGWHRRLKLV